MMLKTYSYQALRPCITEVLQSRNQANGVKSDEDILLACVSKNNRALVEYGAEEGCRNSSGAKVARDLIGTKSWLEKQGFSPNPRGLFDQYCQRCTPPLDSREADLIWQSAEKSNPTPCLSEDKLEKCLAAARKQLKVTLKKPELLTEEDPLEEIQSELTTLHQGVRTQAPIAELIPALTKPLSQVGKCLNVPLGAYVITLLAATASLIHSETRLEISPSTDFNVPPVIWSGLVGDSSALKSPIYRAIVGPLNLLQKEAHEKFKQDFETYERELDEWEEKKKRKERSTDLAKRPKPPILRRYCVQNATPEAIGKIVSEQLDRGFLEAVDELPTLVKGMDQYKSGGGNERSLWLSAYDAGPWSQERKTGPDVYAPHSSISVTGTIQPSTLRRLMGRLDEVDGFWPRFMWCYLPGDRVPPPTDLPRTDLSGLLKKVYEEIAQQPKQKFKFDSQGRRLWREWHEWIEDERERQSIEAIRAIYRKSLEQAGRVALVVHCLNAACTESQPSEIISPKTLQEAIEFTKWTISQSLYIYGQFGLTQIPETKKYLAIVHKFKGQSQVKPKQIQRAWGRIDVTTAHTVIDALVQMGMAKDNGKKGADRRLDFLTTKSVDLLTDTHKNLSLQGFEPVNKDVDHLLTASVTCVQNGQHQSTQVNKDVDRCNSDYVSDTEIWSTNQLDDEWYGKSAF